MWLTDVSADHCVWPAYRLSAWFEQQRAWGTRANQEGRRGVPLPSFSARARSGELVGRLPPVGLSSCQWIKKQSAVDASESTTNGHYNNQNVPPLGSNLICHWRLDFSHLLAVASVAHRSSVPGPHRGSPPLFSFTIATPKSSRARRRIFSISSVDSLSKTITRQRLSRALFSLNDGFSVVAPIRVIVPFSTKGRNVSFQTENSQTVTSPEPDITSSVHRCPGV